MDTMPAITACPKRALLLHTNGLVRILGIFDPAEHEAKTYIELMIGEEKVQAGLIKVTTRTLVYKQITEPITGKFDDFHPEQV